MAKNINQAKVERQYKQKMLAMTGSVSHTLNIADQAMDLAEQFMTEGELSNSDAYYMQQQVRLAYLIQSRLEGVYQIRRQFTDKAHRIG